MVQGSSSLDGVTDGKDRTLDTMVLIHKDDDDTDSLFELEEVAEDEAEKRGDNAIGMERLNELFEAAQTACKMNMKKKAMYNGHEVSMEEKKVLVHVVDQMQDHFSADYGDPNLKITLHPLTKLERYVEYHAKAEPPGDRWYSPINIHYRIDKTMYSNELVAFDQIYVDLVPKKTRDGHRVQDYGANWVSMYFPERVMAAFVRKFTQGTSWTVSDNLFHFDPTQGLWSIEGKMDQNHPPSFYLVNQTKPNDPSSIELQNQGSVRTAMYSKSLQHIYCCTAFVYMSMQVMTDGNAKCPQPMDAERIPAHVSTRRDYKAKLTFHLRSIRAFSEADHHVRPVGWGYPPTTVQSPPI